jgi:hypothetical protein
MTRLRGSLQGHRCVVQRFRTVGLLAVSTHTFPITAAVRCAVRSREGEEPGATPCRAGDGAGNGREAGISRPLPLETMVRDGDGMALAVIVANEHRAGFEPAAGRAGAARQTLQTSSGFHDQGRQRPVPAGARPAFAPTGSCSNRQAAFARRPPANAAEAHQAQASAGERFRPRSRPDLSAAAAWLWTRRTRAVATHLAATIRYTRPPSVFSDSSFSASFLRTTPAKNPRTECGCQPVDVMIVAMVAPLGLRNRTSGRRRIISGILAMSAMRPMTERPRRSPQARAASPPLPQLKRE